MPFFQTGSRGTPGDALFSTNLALPDSDSDAAAVVLAHFPAQEGTVLSNQFSRRQFEDVIDTKIIMTRKSSLPPLDGVRVYCVDKRF